MLKTDVKKLAPVYYLQVKWVVAKCRQKIQKKLLYIKKCLHQITVLQPSVPPKAFDYFPKQSSRNREAQFFLSVQLDKTP